MTRPNPVSGRPTQLASATTTATATATTTARSVSSGAEGRWPKRIHREDQTFLEELQKTEPDQGYIDRGRVSPEKLLHRPGHDPQPVSASGPGQQHESLGDREVCQQRDVACVRQHSHPARPRYSFMNCWIGETPHVSNASAVPSP